MKSEHLTNSSSILNSAPGTVQFILGHFQNIESGHLADRNGSLNHRFIGNRHPNRAKTILYTLRKPDKINLNIPSRQRTIGVAREISVLFSILFQVDFQLLILVLTDNE